MLENKDAEIRIAPNPELNRAAASASPSSARGAHTPNIQTATFALG